MSGIIEKIDRVSIANSMKKHFIDYSMSVITERALPDVRDGLKPVQRRILYGTNGLGLTYDKPYKKSARIVGDVLGKYHPHGDTSVYEAMVKMSQDFAMRYPMIAGHGNFGSIDGDGAAAMRYTEAKLSLYGQTILDDINKNTIDLIPNFDGEEVEPSVLPTLIPNMILNGTSGIAVGMATSMAPHNIRDVYNALDYIIDCEMNGEEADTEEVINRIQAPDFPTGGVIINIDSVRESYKVGNGRITIRGVYEVDDNNNIVITEIPFKVNKARLVERIDDLSRVTREKGKPDKPAIIGEIKEVRDESAKVGIRIVIELKKDANPQLVINKLLKNTDLQCNFSINNTVIVDGEPKVLNIHEIMNNFLSHAANVIIRRTTFDYEKAVKRMNIVLGVIKCFEEDMLEKVIQTIRHSEDPIASLIELGFNEEQAEHVSEIKLKALSRKSEDKYIKEKEALEISMEKWSSILNNNQALLRTMKMEFNDLKNKFGDDRRTAMTNDSVSINEEDLIKDEALIVTITDNGLIKSVLEDEYNAQKRGGKGTKAASTKEDEIIKYMFTTNSKDHILFFTNLGKVHLLKAYKIPKSSKSARGKSVFNFLSLDTENGEHIVNVIASNTNDNTKSLLLATRKGVIKRLQLDKLSTRLSVTKIIEFREGDSLMAVQLVSEGDNVILNTANGLSLTTKVDEKSIRPMGRTATGVMGMKMKDDDYLVDMSLYNKSHLFTLTESGLGKKTPLADYTVQNRGGKGIISHKVTSKTGKVLSAATIDDNDDLFIVTAQGLMIRVKAKDISSTGRSTSGVKLVSLNEGDSVVGISVSACPIDDIEIEVTE